MAAAVSSVSAGKRAQNEKAMSDEEYDKHIRSTISKIDRSAVRAMAPSDIQELLGVSLGPETCIHAISDPQQPAEQPGDPGIEYLILLTDCLLTVNKALKAQKGSSAVAAPGGYGWTKVVNYLATFDPIEARYAGRDWRYLVELIMGEAQRKSTVGGMMIWLPESMTY
jgi:hypothetical protein